MFDDRPPISRRQFSRLLAGGSLAVVAGGLATVATVQPASAGRAWCRKDPEFRINGNLLHVYLAGPAELDEVVNKPSIVTLFIPSRGVDAQFIWADEGFNGQGYTINIVKSKALTVDPVSGAISIEIETVVSAKGTYSLEVEAVYEHKDGHKIVSETHKGKTNRSIRQKAKL